ncbi:hypothetical protein [Methanosarcina sp.]|uniref:hypothetical protein n=1 Tax=Methanosarcina sp. TaxID=2213 RepID=UPI0029888B5A|nr:hypothetical protein [Methanosarcina sp.]MDW5549453.1 hypothetical protein [Methanosarcina sp.]MDW5553356.1 hypothetical protein [Methanosarcina sp.]MDW5559680.1 hypothetical protein [Methanosarcina sp.]
MAFETVKRNIYYDPDRLQLSTGNRKDVESQSELDCLEPDHIGKNHYQDFEEFHLPIDRMHNSNLHDWGIARGLEVKGTIGGGEVIINPGVAIDIDGQLISLSDTGHGDTGKNPPGGDHKEVPVPVKLSTEYSAGMKVYVTIQFSEILRSDQGAAGMKEQVPWVRLQPIESYISEKNNGSKSIILAVAVINDNGKLAELKAKDSDLPNCRRLIGESVEELRIQRSGNVEGTVQDIVTGKIGPGDGGGLKIIVPAKDSVLFAREDGGDFKSLGINANVGIGTTDPLWDLDVSAKSIKLGLEKYGGGQLILKNNQNDNMIYLEAFGSNGKGSASALVLSGENNNSVPVLNLNAENTLINGNVGIGTTDPSARLEVNGNIKADASELETLVVKGKVGIGTTDPDCALHVNGTKIKLGSEKEGQLLIAGENNFLFLEANGSNDTGTVSELTICGNSTRNIPKLKLSADNTFFGGSITVPGIINSNQNLLVQGNVGIGTADPKDTLDVYGQIRLFGQNAFQGSDPFLRINPDNNFPSGTHFAYRASFYRGITTGDWWDVEPGIGNLLVQGNVGIGTSAPSARLDIQGATRINDNDIWLRGGTDCYHGIGWYGGSKPFADNTSINGPIVFGYNGGALGTTKDKQKIALHWNSDGKVGVGTTDPLMDLDVSANSIKLGLEKDGGGQLILKHNSNDNQIYLEAFGSSGKGSASELVLSGENNSNVPVLRLNAENTYINGNVGIGTTTPSATLEVNGDLKAKNKKFSINHPLRPDTHNLVHSTLEGPETAVFYRGEAQLLEGEKTILLPDYFEALTRKENRTVLLTPKFEENFGISMLAASEVRDGKFTVKMIDNNNSSQKFYWEVKAIRSDVEILEVEPAKAQVNSNVQ